jgi:hypothetical protein
MTKNPIAVLTASSVFIISFPYGGPTLPVRRGLARRVRRVVGRFSDSLHKHKGCGCNEQLPQQSDDQPDLSLRIRRYVP